MKIGIVGATSQIALDFIRSTSEDSLYEFYLYSRRPEAVEYFLQENSFKCVSHNGDFATFGDEFKLDALVNYVGAGDPDVIRRLGPRIVDITEEFDQLCLKYISKRPECKYIFLSSGAAYGKDYKVAVDESSYAQIPLNNLKECDWYSIAKLIAECRHRSSPSLSIIDIRLFNYFSAYQSVNKNFFVSQVVRSIRTGLPLVTSSDNIIRDYLTPPNFARLMSSVLSHPFCNDVIDAYSKEPVDKFTLLNEIKSRFGLVYCIDKEFEALNATGHKLNYYSKNTRASKYGYVPIESSLSGVLREVELNLTI